MQLHIELDAAYLVIPGARSCAAEHFYFAALAAPNKKYAGQFNAPIHTECHTICNVISSAAKAECAALFHNYTVAVGIRNTLAGLGHPQHCTDVITDNSTANSFFHSEMRVKRSKSLDILYNWLRDCSAQCQFKIWWDKGIHNMADYFTKHHPPSHHRVKRHDYVLKGN